MNGARRGFWLLGITCAAMAAAASPAAATPSLVISWDAVDGAARYRLYRATSLAGPWSLLRTTTATSARVEVPPNETRCYRVRAVDELAQASPDSARLCASVTVEVTE